MIVFCWDGFPQYAARCVGALARTASERVAVVATRPKVPIAGMDRLAGCQVVWIGESETRTLDEVLGGADEGASIRMFVSGWSLPVFNRFRDEVRTKGGKTYAMLDNNLSLKNFADFLGTILRSVKFRLCVRRKYNGFFVPGEASRKLLRFYGVADGEIATGVYAADDGLFRAGEALSRRSRMIVYVGQFIERKNVKRMCRAFIAAGGREAGWTLELYGSGALEAELRALAASSDASPAIVVNGFLQPEELAAKYREARAFCLPSVEEHWGLVVHEAALSGCLLLLSDRVGAREDFEGRGNVLAFDPHDEGALASAFRRMFSLSDAELDAAGAESVRLGRTGASLVRFVDAVRRE